VQNALVPISPAGPKGSQETAARQQGRRPNADFIAQLIAASIKAPQTRARRRATPGEASALYRAHDHEPAAPGRTFSRSL
jgi:hypothetical protein